jgi:hypothetical protein
MRVLVGRFVFQCCPVGEKDDFVFMRYKRIFGEIQVNVITPIGQLDNGAAGLLILIAAFDFRFGLA